MALVLERIPVPVVRVTLLAAAFTAPFTSRFTLLLSIEKAPLTVAPARFAICVLKGPLAVCPTAPEEVIPKVPLPPMAKSTPDAALMTLPVPTSRVNPRLLPMVNVPPKVTSPEP